MLRGVVRLICASVLLLPVTAGASFHVSRLSEVMSGAGGNPDVQYVEIEMMFVVQNTVRNSRLTAFNCDGTQHAVLLVVPSNVPHDGNGVHWIMASPDDGTFFAASGIHPDFTFSPGIEKTCGMVCWGAPGFVTPDPTTWDAGDPNQYVDCLAYGSYTGPRKTSIHDGTPTSGTPTTLTPGDGTKSLTRSGDTQDNAADFVLACPTPTNNTGNAGSFGCGSTTTTTTLPTGGGEGCPDLGAFSRTRAQVESQCPCASQATHAAYVKCAVGAAKAAVRAGTLPRTCQGAIKQCAARSTCGRAGAVTCCRTTAKGTEKCAIKSGASACKAPKRGTACVGSAATCCDSCSPGACASATGP
jgi:hypothetical protein